MAAARVTLPLQQTQFFKSNIRISRPLARHVKARAAVTELNSIEEYKSFIDQEGVCVVDFYAAWCAPCKQIAPKIEEMAAELTDIKFGKLNLTQTANVAPFAREMEIKSMPCFHIYKNGGKLDQMTGNNPEGLKKMAIAARG